eukprot:GILJ01003695.1.p1 GENE.GILJ01003695.1~~GILJ01003695.1.p1  ORF type:complete len:553 (-),score=91.42 GILJ01003695.1:206-1819(-)
MSRSSQEHLLQVHHHQVNGQDGVSSLESPTVYSTYFSTPPGTNATNPLLTFTPQSVTSDTASDGSSPIINTHQRQRSFYSSTNTPPLQSADSFSSRASYFAPSRDRSARTSGASTPIGPRSMTSQDTLRFTQEAIARLTNLRPSAIMDEIERNRRDREELPVDQLRSQIVKLVALVKSREKDMKLMGEIAKTLLVKNSQMSSSEFSPANKAEVDSLRSRVRELEGQLLENKQAMEERESEFVRLQNEVRDLNSKCVKFKKDLAASKSSLNLALSQVPDNVRPLVRSKPLGVADVDRAILRLVKVLLRENDKLERRGMEDSPSTRASTSSLSAYTSLSRGSAYEEARESVSSVASYQSSPAFYASLNRGVGSSVTQNVREFLERNKEELQIPDDPSPDGSDYPLKMLEELQDVLRCIFMFGTELFPLNPEDKLTSDIAGIFWRTLRRTNWVVDMLLQQALACLSQWKTSCDRHQPSANGVSAGLPYAGAQFVYRIVDVLEEVIERTWELRRHANNVSEAWWRVVSSEVNAASAQNGKQ